MKLRSAPRVPGEDYRKPWYKTRITFPGSESVGIRKLQPGLAPQGESKLKYAGEYPIVAQGYTARKSGPAATLAAAGQVPAPELPAGEGHSVDDITEYFNSDWQIVCFGIRITSYDENCSANDGWNKGAQHIVLKGTTGGVAEDWNAHPKYKYLFASAYPFILEGVDGGADLKYELVDGPVVIQDKNSQEEIDDVLEVLGQQDVEGVDYGWGLNEGQKWYYIQVTTYNPADCSNPTHVDFSWQGLDESVASNFDGETTENGIKTETIILNEALTNCGPLEGNFLIRRSRYDGNCGHNAGYNLDAKTCSRTLYLGNAPPFAEPNEIPANYPIIEGNYKEENLGRYHLQTKIEGVDFGWGLSWDCEHDSGRYWVALKHLSWDGPCCLTEGEATCSIEHVGLSLAEARALDQECYVEDGKAYKTTIVDLPCLRECDLLTECLPAKRWYKIRTSLYDGDCVYVNSGYNITNGDAVLMELFPGTPPINCAHPELYAGYYPHRITNVSLKEAFGPYSSTCDKTAFAVAAEAKIEGVDYAWGASWDEVNNEGRFLYGCIVEGHPNSEDCSDQGFGAATVAGLSATEAVTGCKKTGTGTSRKIVSILTGGCNRFCDVHLPQ